MSAVKVAIPQYKRYVTSKSCIKTFTKMLTQYVSFRQNFILKHSESELTSLKECEEVTILSFSVALCVAEIYRCCHN